MFPDEDEVFKSFLDNIEYSGGYGYCNVLEAISLALQPEWISDGYQKKQVIWVFSNGKVRPIEGNQRLVKNYPTDMPTDITHLNSLWETSFRRARLIVCAPYIEPWIGLQNWNRFWPTFSNAGVDLTETDIQATLDLIYDDL